MNTEFISQLQVGQLASLKPAMNRCLKLAARAASSELPVLILGETGTGKTLLAQVIHNSSPRARGPFVSFNASAMSDTLLESQLFGHERGAFTGAHHATRGKFELTHQGTLFLDEIADMSLLAQAKILRAVEYGQFERLGSETILYSNARIISATHRSLHELIERSQFRNDLYHRLNGLSLFIPALRDRPEDLPALIASELQTATTEAGKAIHSINTDAMQLLLDHPWPGNLRELHHTLRSIVLFCDGPTVLPEHIVFDQAQSPSSPSAANGSANGSRPPVHSLHVTLAHAIRQHVYQTYNANGSNQRQTAKVLGISRARLARLLRNGQERAC